VALRQEQNRRFRRFLGRASIGSLVPGVGLVLGGRRWLGALVLTVFLGAVAAAWDLLTSLSRSDLVALAVDPRFLALAAAGFAALAVLLLLSSASSHHLLQPPGIRGGQRLVGALVITLVTSIVVAPVAMASRYALVQYELVTTVFTATDDDTPDSAADDTREPGVAEPVDPWQGVERVNVLLLGSDAGPGREGTRPDTAIVASVDTATGDTVLFSLPRNLQDVPFPRRSPLAAYYPSGWQGYPGDQGSELLNAVYRYVPADHPELFITADDPGAEAMKLAAEGITGLAIDYYVMVDLDGFQQVVDALGGIDITVRQPIPLESSLLPNGVCTLPTRYLQPGRQRLDGYEALWYARVRCGGPGLSDDYDRMRRQRCVIGAMIERADPLTILRRYESLAGAAQRIVSTDIPTSMVPAFADLGLRVQQGTVRTLPFTDRVIDPAAPDYVGIQQQVVEALAPPPDPTPPPSVSDSDDPSELPSTGGTSGGSGGGTDSTTELEPSSPDESDGVLDIEDVC
jgi:LCP family protein required for cell wall assembly